ncbi:pyrimidine reductase family protein [Microbacterium sp. H1-D42]|uniref:pyrimidine reductase family protein n=1 Tax=Microbacterium sp. H1-D42 TaxID=2925844 RepID=UPI001F532A45|nr:pyrimidine reductase family protein [Microbacterium sp. H1-D42]UNK70279.1 pyrimidine reductase family protein [Microbacterium sp. H1-D42]
MSDSADAVIDRVWPDPASDLSDTDLLSLVGFPAERTWLRVNFIASIDGAATRDGRSGGLGDEADHRMFDLLRYEADVVLVGAGTLRDEGYGGFRVSPEAVAWRTAHGMTEHPALAMVSRSLALDPASPLFTDAPARPVVYTVASAPRDRRVALGRVADIVEVGESDADLRRVRDDLTARGLRRIHSEGGPHLFGALLAARVVDALHLTLAPTMESGEAGRIARGHPAVPVGAHLASILRSGDELLLQYLLQRASSARASSATS